MRFIRSTQWFPVFSLLFIIIGVTWIMFDSSRWPECMILILASCGLGILEGVRLLESGMASARNAAANAARRR